MLSVCIIVKNEEKNIARCLQCLKPYDFEIVVVDTGSTDRTREIASQYTDKIYEFAWRDDFALAKNYAISKAQQPYVMVIDSDEFLEEIDTEKLYDLLNEYPEQVGRIRRKNIFTRNRQQQENQEWINRIFSKERFCYEGRIHEQVVAKDGSQYKTYQAPVVIAHTGYDLTLDERKKKAERNFLLLQQELQCLEEEKEKNKKDTTEYQKIEEQIPYILYQLGKSCYMAEQYQEACEYFSKGLSYDLNPKLEYVIDMVEAYGYALLNSNQAQTALFFENIYEEFKDSADFQFLMGLIYMNNACFTQAVEEFQKATQHKECKNKGTNSYSAYYNIGVIYECLGEKEEAVCYYKKCGDYEPAKKRILEIEGRI